MGFQTTKEVKQWLLEIISKLFDSKTIQLVRLKQGSIFYSGKYCGKYYLLILNTKRSLCYG